MTLIFFYFSTMEVYQLTRIKVYFVVMQQAGLLVLVLMANQLKKTIHVVTAYLH